MKELDKEQKKYVVGLFNCFNGCYNPFDDHKKQMNNFLKEKGLIEEEFEVGEWYKFKNDIMFYESHSNNYGIIDGEWRKDLYFNKIQKEMYSKATPEEVQEALIKEAKKIGFKEGVDCYWEDGEITHRNMRGEFKYNSDGNYLCIGSKLIFENGLWASIVEEKEEIKCCNECNMLSYKSELIINGETYVKK